MKTKKKSKWIIIIVVVGLVLLVGGLFLFRGISKKASALPSVSVGQVVKMNLENALDIEGTVVSDTSEQVFAKLALPVLENKVEIGARVKAGDVLCTLDTTKMEQNIEQQRAALNASDANNGQSISVAQNQRNRAAYNRDNDLDAQIFQAEQAVRNAELGVEQAERGVENAELSVETAGIQFRAAQNAVKDAGAESDWNGQELQDWESHPLLSQRELAYKQYETAKKAVEDAKKAVTDAKEAVENAKNSLEITRNSTDQQVDAFSDGVRSSQVASQSTASQRISLGHLEEELADGNVVAPVDGVITDMQVKKGATPAGMMYIIEDVANLKVSASVKEYDLANIKEGTPARIKSYVSGEETYEGEISKIFPTSIKDAKGESANPTDPSFSIEVNIPSTATNLKIGTKARMDLLYESKEDALAVPLAALGVNAAGEDVVFILRPETDKIFRVVAVAVETGMETDNFVEIIAGELKEGDEIVTNAQGVLEDSLVQKLEAGMVAEGDAGGGGPIGMGGIMIGRKELRGLDTVRYGK